MVRNERGRIHLGLLAVIALVVSLLFYFLLAPSVESAKQAMEDFGFNNITNVERHYFFTTQWKYGCGQDDAYAFSAEADSLNPQIQKRVNVVLCKGFLKGYTLRVGFKQLGDVPSKLGAPISQ